MSLEEILLRDVLADPDDDMPRRLYADWLLDQPDPRRAARGEFIHIQCERAARGPDDPDAPELLAAEYALLTEHRHAWDAPLAGLADRCDYRRGFVEGVTLSARAFLDHAAELFKLSPIHEVRLRGTGWLMLDVGVSPHLAPLTALDLRENEIDVRGLSGLGRSTHAARLASLDLSRNPLVEAGVRALLEGAFLPALRVLRLNGVRLGREGIRELVWSRRHPRSAGEPAVVDRLTALEVADCGLGLEGVESVWYSCPAALRELDLSRNDLGGAGMQAMARRSTGRRLGHVERLNISGNGLGPAGAEALAEMRGLDRLTTLDLSRNGLGDEGVRSLDRPYNSRRWAELALAGNGIGPAGARALAEMRDAELLRRLDLSRNELGAGGAEFLAGSPGLAGLTDLNLGYNKLGPAGVENLLASPHLTGLRRLALRGNGIGARGVRALLDAPHLDGLLALDVSGNKLDEEDVRRLRRRFGARLRA